MFGVPKATWATLVQWSPSADVSVERLLPSRTPLALPPPEWSQTATNVFELPARLTMWPRPDVVPAFDHVRPSALVQTVWVSALPLLLSPMATRPLGPSARYTPVPATPLASVQETPSLDVQTCHVATPLVQLPCPMPETAKPRVHLSVLAFSTTNGSPAELAELHVKLLQSDAGAVATGADASAVGATTDEGSGDGTPDGTADGRPDWTVAGFEPLAPALCEAPTEPGIEASRTPMTTAITMTARRVAAMPAGRPDRVRRCIWFPPGARAGRGALSATASHSFRIWSLFRGLMAGPPVSARLD